MFVWSACFQLIWSLSFSQSPDFHTCFCWSQVHRTDTRSNTDVHKHKHSSRPHVVTFPKVLHTHYRTWVKHTELKAAIRHSPQNPPHRRIISVWVWITASVWVCVCVWSGFFIISDPRHGNKHSRHRSSVLTLEKLLPLERRSEERRRTIRTQPKRSEHLNTCAYRPPSRFNIHNHRSFSLSCLWTICSINDSSDEFRTSPTYSLCSSETGYLRKVPQTEEIKS